MPALVIPSTAPPRPSTPEHRQRPSSPERPPVSPITPVATLAELVPTDPADFVLPPADPSPIPDLDGHHNHHHEYARRPPIYSAPRPIHTLPPSSFAPPPPPVPISESENADVIALRSAISLLQMQREKSRRDLQALESIKQAAVAQPDAFVQEAKAGRQTDSSMGADMLGPTLAGMLTQQPPRHQPDSGISETDGQQREEEDDDREDEGDNTASSFPPVPGPQNVFRCPPINWSKYHIVGESLDKLHAEQRQRPSTGEPQRGPRAPVHVIAAPYSPFADQLHPMQTRKGSKKS